MKNIGFGFKPTHPGEVLKDEIEYRPLTTTTAMMFEAALGVPAYSLIHIQTEYNLQIASNDKSLAAKLSEIRKLASIL